MRDKAEPEVIIIGNYLQDKQESMIRVSSLYKDIADENGIKTRLIRPADRFGRLRVFFPRIEKWLHYVDKFIIFPIELVAHNIRHLFNKNIVYHITDHSNAIYSLFLANKPKIITCHDVLAIKSMMGKIPESRLQVSGKILQSLILIGLRMNQRIVCVSKKTEIELRKLISDKKRKITTTLQPLNYDFVPMQRKDALTIVNKLNVKDKICLENGFIFHVGGNQWYKNRLGLCAIYKELDRIRSELNKSCIPLVMAGKKPTREIIEYTQENRDLNIIFVISPSNEEINALYSLASVLLFPSIEEGFGWPIVEAMACGCPVVTTEREPMKEAGGNAAIYLDPYDIKSAAKKTNKVIEWSKAKKERQKMLGYRNVERFSREKFAEEYRVAYEDRLQYK